MLITSNHNNRLLCLKSKQAIYLTISNLHNIFMFQSYQILVSCIKTKIYIFQKWSVHFFAH